jgi:hypothetical protein
MDNAWTNVKGVFKALIANYLKEVVSVVSSFNTWIELGISLNKNTEGVFCFCLFVIFVLKSFKINVL